jgi:hypothetical protein
MISSKLLPGAARGLLVRPLLAALCLTTLASLVAQTTNSMFIPVGLTEGGLSPKPVITAITNASGVTTVRWSGFLKPFTLQGSPLASPAAWQTLLTEITTTEASVTVGDDMQILQVGSPTPLYAGAYVCGACHDEVHAKWQETRHAGAYQTLKAIHMDDPKYGCVACHTVGYGLPTGFRDAAATPQLEGVQCENCHGPGGQHIANTEDVSLRPVITIAAEVCGGCHTDVHHPTFDEWAVSGHGHQSENFNFSGSGSNSMATCGTCHSGGARMADIEAYELGSTNVVYNGFNADAFAITCIVCHDAHEVSTDAVQPAQLRYPTSSTNFFSYYTATNFLAQYNPNIQICGQCHNERGAVWTGTGRPPHHSPQYNILIGQVAAPGTAAGDEFNGVPAGHGNPASNPMQCVTCHMEPETPETITEETPNYTGHRFEVKTSACADCHGFADDPNAEAIAEGGIEFIQSGTKAAMAKTIAALNEWAATKIPGLDTPGSTNYVAFYGTNAPSSVIPWEFNPIGQLNTGKTGPGAAGQKRLPNAILKSRFLLYLVEHDASYGVHNPAYVGSDPEIQPAGILQKALDYAKNAPPVPAN